MYDVGWLGWEDREVGVAKMVIGLRKICGLMKDRRAGIDLRCKISLSLFWFLHIALTHTLLEMLESGRGVVSLVHRRAGATGQTKKFKVFQWFAHFGFY